MWCLQEAYGLIVEVTPNMTQLYSVPLTSVTFTKWKQCLFGMTSLWLVDVDPHTFMARNLVG